jgi:hypothetical protein
MRVFPVYAYTTEYDTRYIQRTLNWRPEEPCSTLAVWKRFRSVWGRAV